MKLGLLRAVEDLLAGNGTHYDVCCELAERLKLQSKLVMIGAEREGDHVFITLDGVRRACVEIRVIGEPFDG
jgi:hypothetical protein